MNAYYDKQESNLFAIFGVNSKVEALEYCQGKLVETALDLPFDHLEPIDIKELTDFLQDGEALSLCGIHDEESVEDLYNALII